MSDTLRKRAQNALSLTRFTAATHPALVGLVNYAAQSPGFDPNNYYSDWRDKSGQKAYRHDARDAQKAWRRLVDLLGEAEAVGVEDSHVMAAAGDGRYQYENGSWHYITGQYFCVEFRPAACRLVEQAIRARRQELPKHKEMPASIAELKALNKRNGGCWFAPAEIRFFGTRVESDVIAGRFFVTSEQPPHGDRQFSIRSFNDVGEVDTVGKFGAYTSRHDAREALAEHLKAQPA